jgi:Tfp pilus assembly protein FimT
VELLLVLTLLAIFAASLSVSLAGRPDGYAIRVAAEDLAMALRFAATQAKAGQTSHRVAFYENHAQYRVEIADPRTNGGFAPARGQAGQMKSLPTGIRITAISWREGAIDSMPGALQWDALDESFSGTITLVNRQGQTATIGVEPATGQTHVE